MYLGDIVVITQFEEQEQITAFTDFMDQFCRLAKHVCEATVTAGIGYVCDNLPDIRLSWQGARSAVSYRVIYGNARAINIAEIDPMENVDERWEEQEIQKILKKNPYGNKGRTGNRNQSLCMQVSSGWNYYAEISDFYYGTSYRTFSFLQ